MGICAVHPVLPIKDKRIGLSNDFPKKCPPASRVVERPVVSLGDKFDKLRLLFMFFFRLLSRLPFPVLYALSDLLYVLSYYVFGYRKRVVMGNLDLAFPRKTTAEKKAIARQFYHNLADIIVETVKLLTISSQELGRRVTIANPQVLLGHLDRGQSIVVMTAHQGNWEWLLQGCALHLGYDVDAVYKPLRNKFSEKLMLAIRRRFGPLPVPMQQLARALVQRRPVVRIIAMVADQAPPPEMAHWLNFFGHGTPFFTGAAKIAQRTAFPVLFTRMQRLRRGYYQVHMAPIALPPYPPHAVEDIIGRYAAAVQAAIEERPAEWLWSHKRWKNRRPNPDSPIV
jgi:KDO2-lipid IV(A) lauroyltransferase